MLLDLLINLFIKKYKKYKYKLYDERTWKNI